MSEFATFSDHIVYSNAGTPSAPEVIIDCIEGDSAVGSLLFYAPAHLPAVTAQVSGEHLVLAYPSTRFHEVYQLLRDGARTIVVAPATNTGSLLASSFGTSAIDAMKGAGPPLLVTLWRMLEVLTSTTKEAPDGRVRGSAVRGNGSASSPVGDRADDG